MNPTTPNIGTRDEMLYQIKMTLSYLLQPRNCNLKYYINSIR